MPIRSKAQWRTLHAIASRGGISKRKLSKLKRETRVKYSRLPKYKRRRNPRTSMKEYWILGKNRKSGGGPLEFTLIDIVSLFETAVDIASSWKANVGSIRILEVTRRWEF